MRTLTSLILAFLLLSFSSAPAAQAQAKPKKAQLAAAQNHYKRASAFQDLGEFDKAADEYLEAYRLYPHAEFLFNVAEVYRLGDKPVQALEYYKQYLRQDPKGRGAVASRAHIKELEAKVAAAQDEAKADAAAAEVARKQALKEKTAAADAAKSAGDNSGKGDADTKARPDLVTSSSASSPAARPGRVLRIAGLSTAAVGILAIGLGVKFGLDASSIATEVEAADPWDQPLYDRGEAKNRNMFIMYAVGNVAVLAGGALYYLGHKAGKESAPRQALTVSPTVGDSMTGLVVGGSY